jgi:hypothetical protein
LAFKQLHDHFCSGSFAVRAAYQSNPIRKLAKGPVQKPWVYPLNHKPRQGGAAATSQLRGFAYAFANKRY